MKQLALLLGMLGFGFISACVQHPEKENSQATTVESELPSSLSLKEAERLVNLPMACIDIEYPNKLNQVIASEKDLKTPRELHPAFYGCFDWHSAVHGHWSLVRLLRSHPQLKEREQIIAGLKRHLTKEKMAIEIAYFENPTNQGFERMYGWAWLLKLTEELSLWNDSSATELHGTIQPLAEVISTAMIEFLPKLKYPLRDGTHTNTAFGLSLAYDYAVTTKNTALKSAIEKRAKEFYTNDKGCPYAWEPSGYDFLSPCFEEANLMRKILSKEAYATWLNEFMPELSNSDFKLSPGIVSDRKDGHLVHLDGLNFSRAWCLFGIAKTLPETHGHLVKIGNDHIKHSLPFLVGDSYEGGHWLASFALMALTQ